MDWVDVVERERQRYEARLEAISNIVICTCDMCGNEMKHGELSYQIPSKDICICEECYDDERDKERHKDLKCELCGHDYWIEEENGCVYGFDMINYYGTYYCEDCFKMIELCADEDEIANIRY